MSWGPSHQKQYTCLWKVKLRNYRGSKESSRLIGSSLSSGRRSANSQQISKQKHLVQVQIA